MKKRNIVLAIVTCCLTGCSSQDETPIKILCPTGAPSVAFYNYADSSSFETNSKPTNIVSFFNDDSPYDVIVVDSTSGLQAINNGAPFKVGAILTFGNFFIMSTGNDTNNMMDVDDHIVLFGKNAVPDKLFHYIYGDVYDKSIEYVSAASDAAGVLVTGKNAISDREDKSVDYVFLAEPAIYAATHNQNAATYGKTSVYANIQEEYKKKSNNLTLVQACLFINNKASKKKINAFLDDLEKDINSAISNPDLVISGINKITEEEAKSKYGASASVFAATLKNENSLGLGYKNAKDNKEAIDSFIALFGMKATDEEIYY